MEDTREVPHPSPQPHVDPPAEAPPLIPGALALWKLYLAASASFCLYLPFWAWRTARQYGIGDRRRSTPIWWALGSPIAPVGAALLYEFNRRALRLAARPGHAAWPALAHLALFVVWRTTPLSDYFFPLALLVPIPFLFVQHSINVAAARRVDVAHKRRSLNLPLAAALLLGLPVHAFVGYSSDWPTLRGHLSAPLTGGSRIAGDSEIYELTIPTLGWKRVPNGTVGESGSDLELLGPGPDTWSIAYVEDADGYDLDDAVAGRRYELLDLGVSQEYQEKRYFLPGADLVPASLATYDVSYGPAGTGRYVVLTIETETHVVEILGYTGQPAHHGDELHQLVSSLAATTAGSST